MFHESLSATQMTSGMSDLQEKASSSRSLSRQLMDILVEKTIGKPDSMHWVLETWAPSMEGSAGFLQLLKDRMSLKWWRQQEPAIREQILKQLIRIDDGRGIIADWLALIVREENHIAVLQTAAEWESRKYPFTDQLLEAWGDRSFDGLSGDDLEAVNRQAVRETALKVVVNAILPSGLSSGTSPEYVDGSALNEERRAGMILKHLSERLYTGKMIKELEILSDWKPSPVLHGKKILSEIFCEWERHMQTVVSVIMGTGINENLPEYNDLEGYSYLQAAWKGLINSSANCTEAADRLLSGMKDCLDGKMKNKLTTLPPWKVVKTMLQWNPPDESRREEVGVLCSRYLLCCTFIYDGCINPAVLEAMGNYFSGCRNPGPGMEEINRNCLHALDFMMAMKDPEGSFKEKMLGAVVCPPWLTKEQQIKWESLWTGMMANGPSNMLKTATRHLLGLAAAGLSDPKVVKKAISDRILEKLSHVYADLVTEIIDELTDSIGQWKGKWKASPALTALRLEIMNMEVWEKLMEHSSPRIRQCAWKFFVSLGDGLENETGKLLVKWLRKEKDISVLHVMAGWKPSPGGSLPAGFEEGWTKCLQKLLMDTYRSCVFVSGKRIMRNKIKTFHMAENTKDIINVGKDLIRTLVVTRTVASLEGQSGTEGQSAGFDGLRMLWRKIRETVTETMGRFLPEYNLNRSGSAIQQMQGEMAKLFWLDELGSPPERFLFFFSAMAKKKFSACRAVGLVWEDLLETVEGMEMKRLPVNVRHNLGAMAVFMLNWGSVEYSKRYDTEKVFMKLCGDGTWTPDRTPAGWEEFCREFCRICTEYDGDRFPSEPQIKEICRMIRLGHTITDERFHHLFMPALIQFLGSAKPELAAVIESALWREVAGWYEMAHRMGPDGKELDKAGERYWLRQFMRYQEQVSGACERRDRTVEFANSLWTGLNGCLFSREAEEERGNRRVRGWRLNDQEIVFTHPRQFGSYEDGSCPVVPPDRLTGTGSAWRPVHQPSFSFGE